MPEELTVAVAAVVAVSSAALTSWAVLRWLMLAKSTGRECLGRTNIALSVEDMLVRRDIIPFEA